MSIAARVAKLERDWPEKGVAIIFREEGEPLTVNGEILTEAELESRFSVVHVITFRDGPARG